MPRLVVITANALLAFQQEANSAGKWNTNVGGANRKPQKQLKIAIWHICEQT